MKRAKKEEEKAENLEASTGYGTPVVYLNTATIPSVRLVAYTNWPAHRISDP